MKRLIQSLTHYWRINLAVLLAAAVATAVLTGALLVGDSVRGSLRDLTLERLGNIDHALVADRFFRTSLAADLTQNQNFQRHFDHAVSSILLSGTATGSISKTRASDVAIIGLTYEFAQLFPGDAELRVSHDWVDSLLAQDNSPFAAVAINEALQAELNVKIGDQILLSFEQQSDVHRESLFGSKELQDVIRTMRLTVAYILPNHGIGRFGLRPHQSQPYNLFAPLPVLQQALDQAGKANALFATKKSDRSEPGEEADLTNALAEVTSLADRGLKIVDKADYFAIESQQFVLSEALSRQILACADSLQATSQPILTYLANRISTANDLSHFVPYSTISAFDPSVDLGQLHDSNNRVIPVLKADEIVLNEWAAKDLGVQAGDSVDVDYYAVGLRGELQTETTRFVVKAVVPMNGLAADTSLSPEFPGISDADNMADWEPTFPVDLDLIRPKDEAYWDAYRATPKAFVSQETGQMLWKSRFGNLTAIRIGAALGETRANFTSTLSGIYTPESAGLFFRAVKAQGLQSSTGATDFGGLFIGMSLFLVVSAALLVGLLFRLGIEQRAREIGALLAVGYQVRQLRKILMREAFVIAGSGAIVGILGAIAYADLIMYGLRTWWLAAVGTSSLFLHVAPASLGMGYVIALVMVLFATWRTIRRLSKIPVPALLANVTHIESAKFGKIAIAVARGALAVALLLVIVSMVVGLETSAELFTFMGSGTLLLISGLAFFSAYLRRLRSKAARASSSIRSQQMPARNTAVFPGRSMLSVALVACASFMIISVGAFRKQMGKDVRKPSSGAGGFVLMAESEIPVLTDLNDADARFDLGFTDRESNVLQQSTILRYRLLPGEDASCLNLYKPEKPRVLGVPKEQIERGGFTFQGTLESTENPWKLLQWDLGQNVIPAISDFNSVMWILHSGLGKDIVMKDDYGQEVRLRLVGLLQKSIFQSELLIAEEQFIRHFPSRPGFSFFLIDTPAEAEQQTSRVLEKALDDFGLDVTTTASRLESFQAVENTYIAVFQTLGGLGLLLGTVGLGIVLFRNALERRKELATMRAFGFQRKRLSSLLLSENSFLVLLGIAIGSVSALIAIFPYVATGDSQLPWISLAITLIAVFFISLFASALAVSAVVRTPLLPALKAE